MKLAHRFAQLTPEKRPHDPDISGHHAPNGKVVDSQGYILDLEDE
jgi:hypothetical protein